MLYRWVSTMPWSVRPYKKPMLLTYAQRQPPPQGNQRALASGPRLRIQGHIPTMNANRNTIRSPASVIRRQEYGVRRVLCASIGCSSNIYFCGNVTVLWQLKQLAWVSISDKGSYDIRYPALYTLALEPRLISSSVVSTYLLYRLL